MFSKSATLLGMATAASAHIIMTNPVPYGGPDNSPLDPSGSNFPCKSLKPNGGGGGENTYEAGSTQQLTFQGTAVHGGGSCQVSVTTDTNPTTDSVWKVIKSIEGGCPAKEQTGNLPGDDPNKEVPYQYDFKIPEKMPEGEYVLAWTWFNKVGNREMYMNCASVSITGGGGDEGFLETLPDMFTANIGGECTTDEDKDVKFPDAGDEADQFNGATQAWYEPGPECSGGGGGSPGEPGEPDEPEEPGNPNPTPPPAPEPTPTPSPDVPGGVFMPKPTDEPAPEPEEPEQPEQPGNGGSTEGKQEVGSACDKEGAWNCVGGASFQRCGSGAWTDVMPLASGMTCDGGQSSELKVHAIRGTKSMRRRALPIRV